MEKIERVIKLYKSGAIIFPKKDYFICSNFPDKLEQPIKDYLFCHFEVINYDNFIVTFK